MGLLSSFKVHGVLRSESAQALSRIPRLAGYRHMVWSAREELAIDEISAVQWSERIWRSGSASVSSFDGMRLGLTAARTVVTNPSITCVPYYGSNSPISDRDDDWQDFGARYRVPCGNRSTGPDTSGEPAANNDGVSPSKVASAAMWEAARSSGNRKCL
jgi:hypothetical protein